MDFFDSAYDGTPPWDIGRPQEEIVRVAEQGDVTGRVLDIGCGTGENALYLAALGYEVEGLDGAPRAIARARAKAAQRRIPASFEQANALDLEQRRRRYDTVVDCGLFHVLSDAERPLYVRSLAAALEPGGRLFLLCFSDREPPGRGPRRVSQAELRAAFCDEAGFEVQEIRAALFATREGGGAKAWFAAIERSPPPTH